MCRSAACNPADCVRLQNATVVLALIPKMLMSNFLFLCTFNHLTDICLVNTFEKRWHCYYFRGFARVSWQRLRSEGDDMHLVKMSPLTWTERSPIAQHISEKWLQVLLKSAFPPCKRSFPISSGLVYVVTLPKCPQRQLRVLNSPLTIMLLLATQSSLSMEQTIKGHRKLVSHLLPRLHPQHFREDALMQCFLAGAIC